MAFLLALVASASLFGASAQAAQGVVGTPFGFASKATGGGNAVPAAPSDINQLKEWLSDSTPRVILIDKEFDFIGSEETCTDCECCIPESNTCGTKGQNAIKTEGSDWCGKYPTIKCTYDNAGLRGIDVASDKSIVGVGSEGVLKGKGLRLVNGAQNVIIQNIHITNLNPQYIWGGDAISLDGTDNVWIDHVKVSLVGRQMFVSGFKSSGGVTISNSEFDGRTEWSSSCDGNHYWTVLGLGKGDKVTFANNYIHHTSGRAPKLEYDNHWHAYNNYWASNTGHAFDVSEGSNVLMEGNVFEQVKTPFQDEKKPGASFAVSAAQSATCQSALGRACVPNVLTQSGELTAADESVLSNWPSEEGKVPVVDTSKVKSLVMANAGVGKLASSASHGKRVLPPGGPNFLPPSQGGLGADGFPRPPSSTWTTMTRTPTPTPSRTPTPSWTPIPTVTPTSTPTPSPTSGALPGFSWVGF